MIAVALKGLAGRKVRALLTAFAVVIGVSMVSGTFILTDTMQKTFDGLFAASYDETDAVIEGREIVKSSVSGSATIPASLLTEIRALPEVGSAGGTVWPAEVNGADILGHDGKAVAQESVGTSIDGANARFSPLRLRAGAWPQGMGQIAIDAGTAEKEHLAVGDKVRVRTPGRTASYRIAGTVSFGDVDTIGFASIAAWDLRTAQTLLDRQGRFDSISIAAAEGTSPSALVRAVRPLVPDTLQVQDSAKQAEEDSANIDEGMAFIRYFLLGFGAIALFVGAFVIFNTLSITVAQRTREFATLRTLGASRRQVLRSVRIEGLVDRPGRVGDRAVPRVRDRQGHDRALRRLGRRAARGGHGVRAADRDRVDPGRHGRHAARDRPARASSDAHPADRCGPRGLPAAAVAVRVALGQDRAGGGHARRRRDRRGRLRRRLERRGRRSAARCRRARAVRRHGAARPRLVRPLARVLGWPARRTGGVAGELAGANSVRNPGRTASTAAALMIGLTLVTVVAVLGSGLRASTESAVSDQVHADYVVDGSNDLPFAAAEGDALAQVPGVTASTHVRSDKARVRGAEIDVTGIDPATIGRFYRFAWEAGSDGALSRLGADGALVTKGYADDEGLAAGDRLALQTPSGEKRSVVVRGIYDPPAARPLLARSASARRRSTARSPPEERVHVPGRQPAGAAGAHRRSEGLRRRDAAHRRGVPEGRHEGHGGDPGAAVRAARLLGGREPVRDGQHARALGLRAHARARHAARDRHDTAPGAPDDPPRERDHRADRRRAGRRLGVLLAALVTQAMGDYDVPMSCRSRSSPCSRSVAVLAGIAAATSPRAGPRGSNVLDALHYE